MGKIPVGATVDPGDVRAGMSCPSSPTEVQYVFYNNLLKLVQDVDSLPPPRCPDKGLDEEAGGSCVQRGKTSPHDVIDIKHLSVMAATHTQRQVP